MPSDKIVLNQKQKKAVTYEGAPLLIVAGPGTGKTRVITEKIRYLISERNVDPQSILAVTFTDKAAEEMLMRVDQVMPLGYEEPWLSTFHSFCDRILRESGLEIGLDPDYEILTATDQWLFVRNNLFQFDLDYYMPLGNPSKFISALLEFFSRARDEDVDPKEFKKFVEDQIPTSPAGRRRGDKITNNKLLETAEREQVEKLQELAEAYAKYRELKLAASVMDFGDLVYWTLKLFRERPSVLARYQNQFKHILVDEFQDTNYAQYQLIKLLAPPEASPNLLVVGDDAQAIYKFRGASLSNILAFKEDYPHAETVILNKDYRNPQPLIECSSKVARNNDPYTLEAKLGIDKQLEAVGDSDGDQSAVEVLCFDTLEGEAEGVTERIIELTKEGGYRFRDFAILARANSHLDPFVAALKRSGIPYQLIGNRGLLDQPEIRNLIAFLRVVADPSDSSALFEWLGAHVFDISAEEIADALSLARKKRKPLWEIAKSFADNKDYWQRPIHLIDDARENVTSQPPTKILYDFVMETNFVQPFLEEDSIGNQLCVKNLNLFFDKIKEYEAKAENPTVPDFVSYLDLLMEAGENPAQAEIEDVDTVNLLTVHSAKGLEFPVVFMVNLVAGRFPTRRRGRVLELPDALVKDILPEEFSHIQEERRLFYVGCTRASQRLFLTWGKDYGGKRERKPSAFIEELGLDPAPKSSSVESKDQLRFTFIPSVDSKLFDHSIDITGFEPRYISHSQVQTFNQCPLKYKYKYVLGIPAPSNHVLSFGQTIHRTLRDFHRADLFSKKDLNYLYKLYENHWIEEGYESQEHREKRFEEGKVLLERYYNEHEKYLAKPLHLEKKFTLKVAGVPLVGSIDRIDEVENGVEIIDYKTGKVKEQDDVDKDDQLTIYALAARDALNLSSSRLALYFLTENKKVETTRTSEELEEKRVELRDTIEKIKASEFEPKKEFLCQWCEYKELCPEYKVGS
ncbi:MAG: ATP-dependent DNA helicase [Patescibacteria group bacterium]|nr:ATP-dependent DNA helicase [Patescibacteria group bacterium]